MASVTSVSAAHAGSRFERPLGVWSAMRRSPDGRHIRVIIGPSAAGLAAELETAEQAGP